MGSDRFIVPASQLDRKIRREPGTDPCGCRTRYGIVVDVRVVALNFPLFHWNVPKLRRSVLTLITNSHGRIQGRKPSESDAERVNEQSVGGVSLEFRSD